jgi:hydroxymethylpyrimidine pyrophosphatase-like HAD family hydrolase
MELNNPESISKQTEALEWAKKILTNGSLIAFDLDKTVLEQGSPNEIRMFIWSICHTLIHLADQGYNISAVTGNSLEQLSKRFSKALIKELCRYRRLDLLKRFHLFCSSASVYINFQTSDIEMLLIKQHKKEKKGEELVYSFSEEKLSKEAIKVIFESNDSFKIRSKFIVSEYVKKRKIPTGSYNDLIEIAEITAKEWWEKDVVIDLKKSDSELRKKYFINYPGDPKSLDNQKIDRECEESTNKESCVYQAYKGNDLKPPEVKPRTVIASDGKEYCPQIALKDILSFRHARRKDENPGYSPNSSKSSTKDPRTILIEKIKKRMDLKGIHKIAVSPGGRATIDIAEQDSNKKEAISYLIQKLGIKGDYSKGEGDGINVLYFGDEVILRGNDFDVIKIKDIQVFAVNAQRERIPVHHLVYIPRTHQIGPKATDYVLTRLKLITDDLLGMYKTDYLKGEKEPRHGHKTSVHLFREIIEKEIINEKIAFSTGLRESEKTHLIVLKAISNLLTILTREGLSMDVVEKVNNLIDDIGKSSEEHHDFQSYIAIGGSHWDN